MKSPLNSQSSYMRPVGAPRNETLPAFGSCGASRKWPFGRKKMFLFCVWMLGPVPMGYMMLIGSSVASIPSHALLLAPAPKFAIHGTVTPIATHQLLDGVLALYVLVVGSWPMLPACTLWYTCPSMPAANSFCAYVRFIS